MTVMIVQDMVAEPLAEFPRLSIAGLETLVLQFDRSNENLPIDNFELAAI